jgi:hypothetical protein
MKRGPRRDAAMAWRASVLPGSENRGVGTRGSLGNLRDPAVSTDTLSGSGPGIPTPRSPRSHVPTAGSKQDGPVASPSEGSEARRNGGSERLIVPRRRGNWTDGPCGGKEAPLQGTVGRNHGGCSEARVHVIAITKDSRTCKGKAGAGIHVHGSPHRYQLAASDVSPDPQGRSRSSW